MKVGFVIGPYRSPEGHYGVKKNIDRAEEVALCLWKLGYAVFCPHKNTSFFSGSAPEEVFLEGDLELLRRADFAVTVKGWERSEGSINEVKLCKDRNIPLYHSEGVFTSFDELKKDKED